MVGFAGPDPPSCSCGGDTEALQTLLNVLYRGPQSRAYQDQERSQSSRVSVADAIAMPESSRKKKKV